MDAESLGGRAQALKSGETGVLGIAATPQMLETVLARFLPDYRRRHRGVEVRLVEDGDARLPARLERGEVQVALMPAGDQRFHARLLYPVHAVAVLPANHRLGGRAVLDVADLADESLLLLRPEFGSRAWFETACSAASLRPRVLLESAAPHTLIALAAAGYGIAVLPSNALMPGEVRTVPLVQRGASIGRWSAVTWHPRRFLPHYAEQFVDEVVRYCRRGYPGSDLLRRAPRLPRPKNGRASVPTKSVALEHAAARPRKSTRLADKT
jgi:LysR family cyn operon transcriptional activator